MTRTEIKPAVSAVKELLAQEPDALREIVRSVMQAMLEAEMDEALGAGKSERSDARLGYRSGHYPRKIGRAHNLPPVTNAIIVCRLLLDNQHLQVYRLNIITLC